VCASACPEPASSCRRAGAIDAGKPSTLGDGVGLTKEAAWGLIEGPAGLGVLALFAARRSL
jgi:hypothetical protein